eukprot:CAMPEP_0180785208 /NCGR_PEP_ID=MMETSP1038_2-20121128/50055_1 /TAXON_ID=632150 /ORGANISM="Azadinium spinosum, Strain 3D9" /LENGTH=69 /DNA_ID=CAMNT_0022822069 /DNA_START=155 /DNA_END=364 /DNA_ORIENTATION=-
MRGSELAANPHTEPQGEMIELAIPLEQQELSRLHVAHIPQLGHGVRNAADEGREYDHREEDHNDREHSL